MTDADGPNSSGVVTTPQSPTALGLSFVDDWNRYEAIRFIGRGGMGAVWKARDRRLGYVVAIKFVLGDDPSMNQRLVHEAQVQARIDHPNVCRVLEVGEVSGRPYIALQYVDGEPLDRVARRMKLDERVAAMRDVARAVDEAHRAGVIHCDLKPRNILVERRPRRGWRPIVVDFGIARRVAAGDQTPQLQASVALGTPAYMSPEQARGDERTVDERSDVYSLGATLYEVLTGRAPYSDPSPIPILARIERGSLPAPREVAPRIPPELEAVTLRCLASDPARRYASTGDLADDLDRYLDGKVVLGHEPSALRRTRLVARRHRTAAAASVLAFLSVAALIIVAARTHLASRQERLLAQARARLSQQLERDAAEVEASMRDIYLQPLHDVRSERQHVVDRLRAIEAARHGSGDDDAITNAEVSTALGRGYLALGRWREAVDELQASQRSGYESPALHVALGRALVELYQEGVGQISGAPGAEHSLAWLVARRGELAQRYLAPALHELREVRASTRGSTSGEEVLLAARVALCARDLPTSEQLARQVADADAGSSEARQVAGQAAYLAGLETANRGDYAGAGSILARAAEAYASAIRVARSDPALYRAAAQTWLQIAEVEHRQGRSAAPGIQQAIELVNQGALVADPDYAAAYETRADALLRTYWTDLAPTSGDDASLLEQAVDAAARAVALNRDDPRALGTLGIAQLYRGSYAFFHGGTGATWWHSALENLGQALTKNVQDPRLLNAVGLAHRWLGDEVARAGDDAGDEYRLARHSYDQAIAVDPNYLSAAANRVELLATIVEQEQATGSDPNLAAQTALELGQDCLASHPGAYVVLDALARVDLAIARWSLARGTDPSIALAQARPLLDCAAAALPSSSGPPLWRAEADRIDAMYLARRGISAVRLVTSGRAEATKALQAAPNSAMAHVEIALIDLIGGRHPDLEDARYHASRALAIDATLPEAWLAQARTWQAIATVSRSKNDVEEAVRCVERALQIAPRIAEAKQLRDDLETTRRILLSGQ